MKTFFNLLAICIALCLIFLHVLVALPYVVGVYGVLVVSYVVGKIVAAEVYRFRLARTPKLQVVGQRCDVAIAFYNEKPDLLRSSVNSILGQAKIVIGKVVLVDDGSLSPDTADAMRSWFSNDPRVDVVRNEVNRGKRHALGLAIERLESPYVALLDSDTVLEPEALANLIARMYPDIQAVTANIKALNRVNLLSNLIDARYRNAFMVERSAQSLVKSVLCASGVLTVYRSQFLQEVRHEWESQTYLGKPVQFGDDRRLTALALRRGGAIIAIDSVASTEVPTHPWQFVKQQLRWNKSFLRESVLAVRDFGVLTWVGFFSFMKLFFWFFYLSTIANVVIFDRHLGAWSLGLIWIAYVIASGLFRNISVIIREPRLVLLAPIYSLLHVLLLAPLRLVALATILDTRWGTRDAEGVRDRAKPMPAAE